MTAANPSRSQHGCSGIVRAHRTSGSRHRRIARARSADRYGARGNGCENRAVRTLAGGARTRLGNARRRGHRGLRSALRSFQAGRGSDIGRWGARAFRPDRHPGEQRRRELGRSRRGARPRLVGKGDAAECRQRLSAEPAGGESLLHPAAIGQYHHHRIHRRAAYRCTHAGRELLRLQGSRVAAHARAGDRVGTARHPRECDLSRILPLEDDAGAAAEDRRLGGCEDLMGAAVYLASAASRHVTGQYIAVDGGASIA